jgi:hypothetical protein
MAVAQIKYLREQQRDRFTQAVNERRFSPLGPF